MQCPQCNRSVHDTAEYCEHCGHKLSSQGSKKEAPRAPSTPQEAGEKKKQAASQEEPPRKKEESAPKREDRAAHKDQDSRRSDRSENQEKEEEDDQEDEDSKKKDLKGSPPSNGFPWKSVLVFLGLVTLAVVLYSNLRKERRPPPLPEKSHAVGSEPFFTALREGVHRVGDAKIYYQKAFNYMGPEWSPATLPATTPATLPVQQTNFLKAAENFALALENFNTARDAIDGIRIKPIEVDQEKCKSDFSQATANFINASETLNEHAKALYLGDPRRAGRSFITDAKAKYEVADQSLTEVLLAGCNGAYFKFLKASPPGEKEQALAAYKTFFGDRFHLHQSAVELLMEYHTNGPRTETAP